MTTQMLDCVFSCVLRGDKSGPRINLRLEDLLSFETLFKRSGLFSLTIRRSTNAMAQIKTGSNPDFLESLGFF